MVEKKERVTVIMSTYNGSEFIREQLNSLTKQQCVEINLVIRDDGSKDDTVEIIKSYSSKFNNIIVEQGENLGATLSFYEAANIALSQSELTEYYAFCDQDDIWLDNKLINGIKNIKNNMEEPSLYFSNLRMINNKKENIGLLLDDKIVSKDRYNALASIQTYGCTCVFNRLALEKFIKITDEKKYIYHDNWMFSICAFLGYIYYDKEAYINYRQTGKNVSGDKKRGIELLKQRILKIRRLKNDEKIYESIAYELLKNFYNELRDEDKIFLTMIRDYRKNIVYKIKLIFLKRLKTNSISKNICIIGRILLNSL